MYFGKSFKKIKKILKEENVVVSSKTGTNEKEILKFVTYELESGERHYSVINNEYVENVNEAKKFLTKFHKIASLIEDTDFKREKSDAMEERIFGHQR